MVKDYDFSGWATKNNLLCSDGRTILKDAFKSDDGVTVPLVWNHQHNEPDNVLGHALLENRDDGVYAYCKLNDTEKGRTTKELIKHGDISALSIYANQLKQQGGKVIHGSIREVSVVLAGANPGAFIDSVICHNDESDEEAVIYSGESISLAHAEQTTETKKEETMKEETKKDEKTVKEIFDTLTEEQKNVVYAIIGSIIEEKENSNKKEEPKKEDDIEGGKVMKHNVFDNDVENKEDVLQHADIQTIFADAKRYGSLKDSVLQHGITNIDYLFPEATNLNQTPEFVKRNTGWVEKVMGAVHHSPFSRIKSQFADITADDARAKGYVKGNLKKDEVFSLLKRSTTPTTVYKKQK